MEEEGIESSSPCPSIVVAIREELSKLTVLSQPEQHCIYRVPKRLRGVKEEAYTPVVVSIGPFHHNNKDERLLPTETLKLRFLDSFIRRSESKGRGDLSTYFEMVKDKESQIRDSYAEHIPMPSDDFVRMVLLDSVFIIQLYCYKKCTEIMPRGNYNDMYPDLNLAENQLPFFILVDLYTTALKQDFKEEPFTYIACDMLGVDKSRVEVNDITKKATPCLHLLDLLRSHYLPSHPKQGSNDGSIWCPTAMILYEAGVKFCVSNNKPLLDIHFNEEKGILTIPLLSVTDTTESLHRNLLAFEQCRYFDKTTYISDYFYFMDRLINTWEDVNLLVEAGIIDNWLGSEQEVADLINSLSTHVATNSSHYFYATIAKQLKKYRNKRWNRYRATLKHTYFKHPWAVLSVIYAIFLLLFTIGQLVTGMLSIPGIRK